MNSQRAWDKETYQWWNQNINQAKRINKETDRLWSKRSWEYSFLSYWDRVYNAEEEMSILASEILKEG